MIDNDNLGIDSIISPTILFTYPVFAEILTAPEAGAVIRSNVPKEYNNNYMTVRHVSKPYVIICASFHMLYEDLMKYPETHSYRTLYSEACKKYGKDTMNLLIIKDKSLIKRNCIKSIDFIMKRCFRVNKVDITFNMYKSGFINGKRYKETSDFINILYEAIQENYNILETKLDGNKSVITISMK